MSAKSDFEKALAARLNRIQVSNPPTGLSRAKANPPLLKNRRVIPTTALRFIPHPPQSRKPVVLENNARDDGKVKPGPPSDPRGKKSTAVRKFYAVKKQESVLEEGRVSGDGESFENEDFYEKSRCPSWERMPGDGCISDIAEEDEDVEDENDDDDDNDDDDAGGNFDDDYYECDELDEAGFTDDDDDDDGDEGSDAGVSTAASSRISTAKSRASSAKATRVTGSRRSSNLSSCKQSSAWVSSAGNDSQGVMPPLVSSLFAHIQATIYFFVEGEKVGQLPAEVRRLLKWKMSSITPNVIKHCIARSGFKATKRANDWLGYWGKHMKATCFKTVREYQKVNHFPGTFQIGRKDRLWRNLSRFIVHYGKKEFGFVPQTYVLPYDFKLLKRAWDDGNSRQKWILKPPASARGIGIRVIHKWNQIPRKRPVIVQRYLAKPYLINGSKFDLRIYVYVTSYDPLRIYVFEDGLVRFATCKYSSSMKSLSNKFMHLTNYSINKKNEGAYLSNSDETVCQGHKWSLKALWGYFKRINVNFGHVWENIKDVVVKTILACESPVNTMVKQNVRKRSCCHELFGFDVMLDEHLKPWLLEVNISPSLHSNSQLDRNIKGQMVKDLLNLAGFCIPENVITTSTASTSSLNQFVQDKGAVGLSADERSKHAFYVQRHLDERTKQSVLDILTPDDIRMLMETEDENNRRGCFQRIFPSMASNKYLRFFDSQRYYNILLDEWTRRYMREGRSRALGIAVLQGYAEKKLHLGPTSDPAHQWSCPQGLTYRSTSAPVLGLNHGTLKTRRASAPSHRAHCKTLHRRTNSPLLKRSPRSKSAVTRRISDAWTKGRHKSAPPQRKKRRKLFETSAQQERNSAPVLLPKIKKKSTKSHAARLPSSSTTSSDRARQLVKSRFKSNM